MPLQVHRRAGEDCPRCGTRIEAIHFKDYVMCYCPEEQTGGRVLKDRRLSRAAQVALVPAATIGESFESFFDAVDEFFSNLASVRLAAAAARAARSSPPT